MGDGGECDGEEIKNDASLWRKPERKKTGGYARTDNGKTKFGLERRWCREESQSSV
jgi:hypothetical protein